MSSGKWRSFCLSLNVLTLLLNTGMAQFTDISTSLRFDSSSINPIYVKELNLVITCYHPSFVAYYVFNNFPFIHQIDGLVQERCNSIANALELHLSCTNPSGWCHSKLHSDYQEAALLPKSSPWESMTLQGQGILIRHGVCQVKPSTISSGTEWL